MPRRSWPDERDAAIAHLDLYGDEAAAFARAGPATPGPGEGIAIGRTE
jgi:hypothetical protein